MFFLCCAGWPAEAEVIHEGGFEELKAGEIDRIRWRWFKSSEDSAQIMIIEDQADRLGKGSSNKALQLTSEEQPLMFGKINLPEMNVLTLSFLMYEPKEGGDQKVVIRAGQKHLNLQEGDAAFQLTLNNGAINQQGGVYQVGKPQRISLVFNGSSETITYEDKVELGPDSIDVWVDGKRELSGIESDSSKATGGVMNGVGLIMFKKGSQQLLLDDIQILNEAKVAR